MHPTSNICDLLILDNIEILVLRIKRTIFLSHPFFDNETLKQQWEILKKLKKINI